MRKKIFKKSTDTCLVYSVGKTSIARVLAGLWPCFEGVVKKPRAGDIMYLPQRPYLSLGSLRDQLSDFHFRCGHYEL